MPMIQMMMGQDGKRMIAKHIEGRLAFLNTELKITDAQISLWNVFAQAMRDSTTAMPAMPHAVTGIKKAVALPDQTRCTRDDVGGASRGRTQAEGGR